MRQLFLITDTFPPQFAPRMGYLCKYLYRETDWRVICLHEEVDFTSHPAVFGTLTGFVQKEYTFVKDEYAHQFTFLQGLHRFLKGQFSFVQFFVFAVSKFLVHLRFRGWDYTAHRLVRKILRENKIDLILGSTGGGSVTMLADYAGRVSGLPVIQDVRDLMEECEPEKFLRNWRWRLVIRDRNECFRRAAALTVCIKNFVNYLHAYNDNISLVYNGYDPEIFHPVQAKPIDLFNVMYVGSVYNVLGVKIFLNGLDLFLEGIGGLENVRVSFYMPAAVYDTCIEPILNESTRGVCKRCEPVLQSELVQKLRSVSVLLSVSGVNDEHALGGISTKVFEYLAVGRPIIDVSPAGEFEAERIIKSLHGGDVVQTAEEVAEALTRKYAEWRQHGFVGGTTDQESVVCYSRENGSRQLIALMNRLVHLK